MAADLRKLVDQLPSADAEVVERARGRSVARRSTRRPTRSATGWPPGARPGRRRQCPRLRTSLRWQCPGLSRATSWPRRISRRPRCSGRPASWSATISPPVTRPCAPSAWPSSTTSTGARVGGLGRHGAPARVLTRIVQLMPPLVARRRDRSRKDQAASRPRAGKRRADRVRRAAAARVSSAPQLPRVIVLHSGEGPTKALDQWEAEAARRGYILIAPEYSVPGKPAEYRYTTSEHAAVELALRDARKRYAIDSDRVFVAGQLSRRATWPGTTPWPIPTSSPAWS